MRPKIATCSYCGTRAALVLDKGRHELVCATCGAPLHDMKALPLQPDMAPKRPSAAGAFRQRPRTQQAAPRWSDAPPQPRRKRRKKRKSLGRKVFEELWDVVEDIFD